MLSSRSSAGLRPANLGAALRGCTLRAASIVARQPFLPREVFICGAARTPFGSFCGSLSDLSAAHLGAAAISAALHRARIQPEEVDAVMLGQALPSGCGQNAVRQAALLAEIPEAVDCTGINKACASGLKAIALAAQAVALGHADVVVAGGMESMSQAPYLLRQARVGGYQYGHGVLEDSALQDGLWDVTNNCHMGLLAERTASKLNITRHDQDAYALECYRRVAEAWQHGAMSQEVTPVRLDGYGRSRDPMEAKKLVVSADEEYSRLKMDSVPSLRPVFQEDGTITAASASSLNDGAAAVVLVSGERARALGVATLGRIVAFADQAVQPADFIEAPAGAVRRALQHARMSSVDFHEVHEAFAVSALASMQLMDLDSSRVNINGGAVALGHPLGASGTRLICALLSVLEQQGAATGCASIANGGGGATAMIVERTM